MASKSKKQNKTVHPTKQSDRHTQMGSLLLKAEKASDSLERMLAVCRCGGRVNWVWRYPWGRGNARGLVQGRQGLFAISYAFIRIKANSEANTHITDIHVTKQRHIPRI
jgi:hypothetical protein